MGEDKDTDRRSLRKGIAWWKEKKGIRKDIKHLQSELVPNYQRWSWASAGLLCGICWCYWAAQPRSESIIPVHPPNPTLHTLLSLIVATAHKKNFVYRFAGLYFSPWAFNYKCSRKAFERVHGSFSPRWLEWKQLSGFDIWAILRWQIWKDLLDLNLNTGTRWEILINN